MTSGLTSNLLKDYSLKYTTFSDS